MPYKAPTRCAEPGCPEISIDRGRCDEHKRAAWSGGNREPTHIRYGMSGSKRDSLHKQALKRDGYICYICGLPGADTADHVIEIADGGAKADLSNLAAIHEDPCHKEKTQRRNAERRARRAARRTPTLDKG